MFNTMMHSHYVCVFCLVPQCTYSRVRRQYNKNLESESGSGWSREDLEKLNEIADMVKKDRELRGATFSSELYKVFKNARKHKAKSDCAIDPKKQSHKSLTIWTMMTIVVEFVTA
jgi:hypothetical protein